MNNGKETPRKNNKLIVILKKDIALQFKKNGNMQTISLECGWINESNCKSQNIKWWIRNRAFTTLYFYSLW